MVIALELVELGLVELVEPALVRRDYCRSRPWRYSYVNFQMSGIISRIEL